MCFYWCFLGPKDALERGRGANSMKKIEFIYDVTCPNVAEARKQIARSLSELGFPLTWKEWNRSDANAPGYVKEYASPTILVDGQDVVGGEKIDGSAGCRVYIDEQGRLQGVPPVEAIKKAIVDETASKARWRRVMAVFPVLGLSALPALSCPVCWPAYAGLLSSVGVGFFNYTPFLLPFMVLFLLLALWMLGYRAKARRGYGPLLVGAIGAILILAGKFTLPSSLWLYGGIGLLIGSSIWNARPVRAKINQSEKA